MEYLGDGNSKGFTGGENTYIYKGLKVVKKECIGHMQNLEANSKEFSLFITRIQNRISTFFILLPFVYSFFT